MSHTGARADDRELAELRADRDDRLLADEHAMAHLGGRGDDGGGIDDHREIVSAQAAVDALADGVVADGDIDRRAGMVLGRLLDVAEKRIALDGTGRLRGIVIRETEA